MAQAVSSPVLIRFETGTRLMHQPSSQDPIRHSLRTVAVQSLRNPDYEAHLSHNSTRCEILSIMPRALRTVRFEGCIMQGDSWRVYRDDMQSQRHAGGEPLGKSVWSCAFSSVAIGSHVAGCWTLPRPRPFQQQGSPTCCRCRVQNRFPSCPTRLLLWHARSSP